MSLRVPQVIHLTWSPGVKSKQTLADDNRSVYLDIYLFLHYTLLSTYLHYIYISTGRSR